jgi:hypothetical protein
MHQCALCNPKYGITLSGENVCIYQGIRLYPLICLNMKGMHRVLKQSWIMCYCIYLLEEFVLCKQWDI